MSYSAFALIDPLSLASATSRLSQQLIYRLVSLTAVDDTQDEVTIVLIDDATAAAFNPHRGYPIRFDHHRVILQPVLCADPAALFIDITFRGVRTDPGDAPDGDVPQELRRLIDLFGMRDAVSHEYCQTLIRQDAATAPREAATTRVMLGRVRSTPESPCDPLFGLPLGPECTIGRQLDRFTETAAPVSVGPLTPDAGYRLAIHVKETGTIEPAPALAMMVAFCDRLAPLLRGAYKGCRDRNALLRLVADDVPEHVNTLYPVWPFFQTAGWIADRARLGAAPDTASPDTASPDIPSCPPEQAERDATPWRKFTIGAAEFWRSLLSFGAHDPSPLFGTGLCLPVDTITGDGARKMATECDGDVRNCARRLKDFFENRMVFYGVDITGIHDIVWSPVLGHVPGTAVHAVAAQNLLQYGNGFLRAPPALATFGPLVITTGLLFELVLIALVAGLILVARHAAVVRWMLWGLAVPALLVLVASLAAVWPATRDGTPFLLAACLVLIWFLVSALARFPHRPLTEAARRLVARFLTVFCPAVTLFAAGAWVGFSWLDFPPANVIAIVLLTGWLPPSDE